MKYDRDLIFCQPHIKLYGIRPKLDRFLECRDGVFRKIHGNPAMGHNFEWIHFIFVLGLQPRRSLPPTRNLRLHLRKWRNSAA